MALTVMKTHFVKQKPNIIEYRDYKKFSNDKFRAEIIGKRSAILAKELLTTQILTKITKIFN